MRKLLAFVLGALTTVVATLTCQAQGEFQFQNVTSKSPVVFAPTVAEIDPAAVGQRVFVSSTFLQLEYGLYVGASSATSFSQLSLFDTSLAPNVAEGNAFAGLINGGAVGTTGTVITGNGNVAGSGITLQAGTTYVVEVAAWTAGDGSSLSAALQSANPQQLIGSTGLGTVTATMTPTPIAQLFGTGAGQLGGFQVGELGFITPEPGTIAIGALGAASLLLLNWRKRRKAAAGARRASA